MSSENWLNMLTGLSQGNFDKLYIKDSNGAVVDILTLLGQGGSGGTVSSATLPLSITNGVLSIGEFTTVSLEDSAGNVRTLQGNAAGQLLYNNIMLVDMSILQQNLANFTQTAQLTTLLAAKQDNLVAGANITISNNVISATGGGTGASQSWVLANCLSPLLNQGSVGVTQGLSSTLSANGWVISVDENTDSRT